MPARKKLTPEMIARIQARHHQGIPLRDIAREVGLGLRTVQRASKMPPTNKPPNTQGVGPGSDGKKPARRKKTAAKKKTKPKPEELDPLELTKKVVNVLQDLLEDAIDEDGEGGKDSAKAGVLATKLTQALSLMGKLTPPRIEDPEDAPDMQAAASRCREKLRSMVAQEIAKRGEAA